MSEDLRQEYFHWFPKTEAGTILHIGLTGAATVTGNPLLSAAFGVLPIARGWELITGVTGNAMGDFFAKRLIEEPAQVLPPSARYGPLPKVEQGIQCDDGVIRYPKSTHWDFTAAPDIVTRTKVIERPIGTTHEPYRINTGFVVEGSRYDPDDNFLRNLWHEGQPEPSGRYSGSNFDSQPLRLFDPVSKLQLSSYGSTASYQNDLGTIFDRGLDHGIKLNVNTALHWSPDFRSSLSDLGLTNFNPRLTMAGLNSSGSDFGSTLFGSNSGVNMGPTSFHNQWNVSPVSAPNQSTLFTKNTTPRSGIESRSIYDANPSSHTQLRLNTPTSLTSNTLSGSQLGFNPFAASRFGGLGGASNIGNPLLNMGPIYNPSQNLSTLGSGPSSAPFGGVGAGFSR